MDYRICKAMTLTGLEDDVKFWISLNWEPIGGAFSIIDNVWNYGQAMIKREKTQYPMGQGFKE